METTASLNYVVDTNVLLADGSAIKNMTEASLVIIPIGVLVELDRHKTDPGETGLNARRAIRILDELREKGSLLEGVQLKPTNTVVKLSSFPGKTTESVDYQVIRVAQRQKSTDPDSAVMIVTNDINLRVQADAANIPSKKYSVRPDTEFDIYSGLHSKPAQTATIEALNSGTVEDIPQAKGMFPNEYLHLRSKQDPRCTTVVRKTEDSLKQLNRIPEVFGISSRNVEQACAIDALLDEHVPLVTLMGKAGTGKTLLAIAAALHMVLIQKRYQRVLVIRPPIPMGKDIGYLPGSLEDKMESWAHPVYDSLEFLLRNSKKTYTLDSLMGNDIINIEPPTYIRGRTLANTVVVIDEAQGLTQHEMKTLITRIGQSSKVVVTGDVHQIDNPNVSAVDNGFSHLVDRFKLEPLSAHVKLTKCERSDLAARAAELL